mmetsp:Transcript_15241/g.17747  ORF Transcript_15241/g.17747 Transcript_15241/m.17747 type:complete len:332 (-) Transcript_15241:218-1213(-)
MKSALLFAPLILTSFTTGFTSITNNRNNFLSKYSFTSSRCHDSNEIRILTSLHMAITPVGPFCPFRSSAAVSMDPKMESLNTATPEFATEMARLQLDMQVGETPDPDRLRKVAEGISAAVDDWESLLCRLKMSNDFQTIEYAKLTQAHLESHGQNTEEIASMMRWQSQCMIAMAENKPPPLPPGNIDIMKMMEEAKKSAESGKQVPQMTQMAAAEKITTTPFTGDEPAFESDTVRSEYEKLCRDHNDLIGLGSSYATFDYRGKLAYLDQIDLIGERWDVFFARFSLLGQLDRNFVTQCDGFLGSMGLTEESFRTLLKNTHDLMRKDAERCA